MKAYLYLHEVKPKNLVATVENLEVIPRGIYEIDGKKYYYSGTPTFVIRRGEHGSAYHKLTQVEVIVEEYDEQDTNGVSRRPA